MPRSQFLARCLNDVGLAAWFGRSLMGAVGLNEAAAGETDDRQRPSPKLGPDGTTGGSVASADRWAHGDQQA
jgi:hypothetical protein